ncbi:MAG TPA: hypothetical protein VFW07_23920 [Parafilimonas sp.]|nr:hypothetical protein [Parafilimonas sp.]
MKTNRRTWIVLEKFIGIILLLWSVFIFYSVVSNIAEMYRSGFMATGSITFSSIVANNHFNIILSVLCVFGSCMLLYKDRTGWMLCVISSFIFGITLFISSRSKATDSTLPLAGYYKSYGAAALLFFVIFILLLLKPIRERYKPTSKIWFWITGVVLLLIIDKIIF